MNALIASIAGVSIIGLFFYNRAYAAALVAFLLPSYLLRFSISGIPFTVLEICILSLAAAVFIDIAFFRKHFPHFWIPKEWQKQYGKYISVEKRIIFMLCAWLLLFFGGAVLGLLVSPDTRAAAGVFKAYIFEPVLLAAALLYIVRTKEDIQLIVWALIGSATLIAGSAILQYATGFGIPDPWQQLPGRRATSVYGFPNAIGLYVTPIAAAAFAWLIHGKQNKTWLGGALVMSILALLAARVDGGLIAFTAAAGVTLIFTRFRFWILGIGFSGLIGLLAFEPTRNLLLFKGVSGDVRIALWKGTWNLLERLPVFGAGLAGFPIVYDIYRLPSHVELLQYPHNIFLNFWVEMGLTGLIWICITLLYMIGSSILLIRKKNTMGYVLLSAFIATVVYGLVDVPYFKNDLSALFWIWIALVIVSIREHFFTKSS